MTQVQIDHLIQTPPFYNVIQFLSVADGVITCSYLHECIVLCLHMFVVEMLLEYFISLNAITIS